MEIISLPDNFPTEDEMLVVLKKTIEQSWKNDLNIEDIQEWLTNFSGVYFDVAVERRLALWLLCNFTFYNEDEVNHMCRVLYKNLLHQLTVDYNLSTDHELEQRIQKTVFTSIGHAGESGGLLLYHFRQESGLDLTRFIFPTHIAKTESDAIVCIDDVIVCIDDVMMSGGTASRFFYDYTEELSKRKLYYITLITTDAAIEKLEKLGITVIYCAKLDSRSQVFSPDSLAFYKYQDIKDYAKVMAEGYGKQIEKDKPLGYKGGQYCFGLYYNIPNNSLPIFWSNQNSWHPILPRKEKYQNAKQANRKYSFFL